MQSHLASAWQHHGMVCRWQQSACQHCAWTFPLLKGFNLWCDLAAAMPVAEEPPANSQRPCLLQDRLQEESQQNQDRLQDVEAQQQEVCVQ